MSTRAGKLIRQELDLARKNLATASSDLQKAKATVADLEIKCEHYRKEVSDLEHDENALTRGYIAIMCDNSVKEHAQ